MEILCNDIDTYSQNKKPLIFISNNYYQWGVIMTCKIEKLNKNSHLRFFTISLENPAMIIYENYIINISCLTDELITLTNESITSTENLNSLPKFIKIIVKDLNTINSQIVTNDILRKKTINGDKNIWEKTHGCNIFDLSNNPELEVNLKKLSIIFDFGIFEFL